MLVQVRVGGDEPEPELRGLHGWLTQEPAVRSTASVSLVERPARPGEMGGWLDAVQLVTDNGWSAASFVLSVVTWRQTRPPRVVIRRGDLEISVTDGSDDEVRRIVALLEDRGEAGGEA
ncbi:hypothetical protein [Streptomyces sp. NPDC026673]|uniref:effector-associated constant component EACC1 n=1 Tax=Streptomyces sp. NPDC026673 TaxID=3155724 RepID=UPI0033EFDCF3